MGFDCDLNNDADDSHVRLFFERGDLGHCPGEKFPYVSDKSLRGKIWHAINGRNEEEYEQMWRYEERRTALSTVRIYDKKIWARRKIYKMKKLHARRYQTTEVTFNDPDILPRYMKRDDFINLCSAVAYANSIGVVFNVHLTITWKLLGYCEGDDADSVLYNLFTEKYIQWCRDKGIRCFWIYSNESCDSVGLHTHFMTSVAENMLPDFKKYVSKRMRKINRLEELDDEAFDISTHKNRKIQRQWIQLQYICKGVDPNATIKHANGIDTVFAADLIRFGHESPGDVRCKRRCGLSRNIDKAARDDDGFKSAMEKGLLNVDILYGDDKEPVQEMSEEEILAALSKLIL